MKNNFFQSAAMHGLIIGLALIVVSLLDWALGFYGTNGWFSILSFVVIAIGLVLFGKAYRDKEMGGYMSYGQAFGYSIVIIVIFVFAQTLFSLLLSHVIDPSYTDKALVLAEQKLLDTGLLSPEQIDKAMEMSRTPTVQIINFIVGIFSLIFMSAIIALITSIFVKRNNPNPFAEQEQI